MTSILLQTGIKALRTGSNMQVMNVRNMAAKKVDISKYKQFQERLRKETHLPISMRGGLYYRITHYVAIIGPILMFPTSMKMVYDLFNSQ